MNILRTILSIVLFGLLYSCQPPVVFGEPQPVGAEVISSIPKSYQGLYWCEFDSTSLFVDQKAFIKSKEFLVRFATKDISADSELRFLNNRLYLKGRGQSLPAEKKGDTIISSVFLRDTIFSVGPEQVLKPFKGHLILNTKLDENVWGVVVVSHKGEGIISLASAELPENLSLLDSISPIRTLAKKEDHKVTQILIIPTRKEFELILQNGLLFDASCTEFERIIPLKDHIY